MDLETGKIVNEFVNKYLIFFILNINLFETNYFIKTKNKIFLKFVDGYNNIKDITLDTKHSDTTTNQLFLTINDKNIFKCDPRVDPKNTGVQSKIYKTNNQFTCVATNNEGNLATGAANGDIRLYKEVGKNAINLYHGWGGKFFNNFFLFII